MDNQSLPDDYLLLSNTPDGVSTNVAFTEDPRFQKMSQPTTPKAGITYITTKAVIK